MSIETYQRVLDELASLDFSGRFSPYLQGEPLLDSRLPDLVALARQTLPRAKLLIQSNGDALTVEKGLTLFKAGLHKMIVNCYDHHGDHVSRVQNIAREMARKHCGLRYTKSDFYHMIRAENHAKISQEITIEDKTWWKENTGENWAGNIPGAIEEPLRKSCSRPFEQLYVQFNGDVVLCCCDWRGEVIFGNLLESSLLEIYSGRIASQYRENLSQKNRKMKLCEVCNYRGAYLLRDRLRLFLYRLSSNFL
jgi:radical SAM protein with 4Fe4S-binding SPASM domain